MKRKHFILSALVFPALVSACTPKTQSNTENNSIADNTLTSITEGFIATHLILSFNNEEKTNDTPNYAFALNLGDFDNLQFLVNALPKMRKKLEDKEPFDIMLIDLPSKENNLRSMSSNLTSVMSSVGMFAYTESPELFFQFLETAVLRWNEQETFVKQDVVYLAEELGLLPNIDITGTQGLTAPYVKAITRRVDKFTDHSPAVFVDEELWTGNPLNPTEIDQLFTPIR